MKKKRVYVETTVISYLTAHPARDLVKQANQQLTHEWWARRQRWELFISPSVLREIRRGDPEAARKRIARVAGLPVLADTDEVGKLAEWLIDSGLVPEKVRDDALHIASATVHRMDYLVTWNQTHIFNPFRIEALYAGLRKQAWVPPVLVRPDNLLEGDHDA